MVARITAAVAQELANGVQDVLRQSGSVLTGKQGDYIANGEPESIYGKMQQATARQYCRRYADDPAAYGERTRVVAENICRPYLDDIGYGTPGSIRVPFRGGQCPGVAYRINISGTWQRRNQFGDLDPPEDPAPPTFSPYFGPITQVALIPDLVARSINLVLNNESGNMITTSVAGWGPGQSLASNGLSAAVVRADGAPDTCGSPPPDITDPIPPIVPGPRVEPYSPSPDINVDIDLEINVDGTVNVDFGTGPITIDPFPEGEGGGGDGGNPPMFPPGDVGEPGSPGSTGPGGDAEGEAPDGSVLVGLKVDIVGTPEKPNEYAPGIYRGVAYVYMGTAEGLDQDYAGSMLTDGQFIFAEKDNLTRWRVRANTEYNLNVTPYYREVEAA